jgi:hypothetical protein
VGSIYCFSWEYVALSIFKKNAKDEPLPDVSVIAELAKTN